MKKRYGIAVLGRFGLGHRLVAWARCAIWCQQNHATMLQPFWFEVPLGPWLRKERDKRMYFYLFKLSFVEECRRIWVWLFTSKQSPESYTGQENTVVVFKNAISGDTNRYFAGLVAHHAFLRSELQKMTREAYIPPKPKEPFIALHIRMGDFAQVKIEDLKRGERNARIPVDWFVEILSGIREKTQKGIHAVVYSDGSDQDLAAILSLDHVSRPQNTTAITDIFAMANASLIIGSGSGMTLWAALLGQVPRLCFTGQKYVSVLTKPEMEIECESRSQLSAEWLRLILD